MTRPRADLLSARGVRAPEGPLAQRPFLRETVRHGAAPAALVLLLTTALAGAGLALPWALGRTLDLLLGDDRAAAAPGSPCARRSPARPSCSAPSTAW